MIAYCDYIASFIRDAIKKEIEEDNTRHVRHFLRAIGNIQWDLGEGDGRFASTKKTLEVMDFNGKEYRITVEEIEEPFPKNRSEDQELAEKLFGTVGLN